MEYWSIMLRVCILYSQSSTVTTFSLIFRTTAASDEHSVAGLKGGVLRLRSTLNPPLGWGYQMDKAVLRYV